MLYKYKSSLEKQCNRDGCTETGTIDRLNDADDILRHMILSFRSGSGRS